MSAAQPSSSAQAAPARRLPGRRGRPTADRAQAIDDAIHAAALDLFVELGFDAASMDAIATGSLVSKGTLYARYESKEQLFRAVIEGEIERLSRKAGANDHLLPSDLEGRLRYHARALVATFDEPRFRRVSRVMQSAALTFPDLDRLWQEIGTRRYLRFLVIDIAKSAEGRGLSSEARETIASLFLYAITGWHRSEAAAGEVAAEDMLAFAERTVALIVRAVRPG